eukprot:6194427-Pleurochrysis_carterae.AAC.3
MHAQDMSFHQAANDSAGVEAYVRTLLVGARRVHTRDPHRDAAFWRIRQKRHRTLQLDITSKSGCKIRDRCSPTKPNHVRTGTFTAHTKEVRTCACKRQHLRMKSLHFPRPKQTPFSVVILQRVVRFCNGNAAAKRAGCDRMCEDTQIDVVARKFVTADSKRGF